MVIEMGALPAGMVEDLTVSVGTSITKSSLLSLRATSASFPSDVTAIAEGSPPVGIREGRADGGGPRSMTVSVLFIRLPTSATRLSGVNAIAIGTSSHGMAGGWGSSVLVSMTDTKVSALFATTASLLSGVNAIALGPFPTAIVPGFTVPFARSTTDTYPASNP